MNLALWLQRSAQVWADRPALGLGTCVAMTYAELADAAAGGAAAWQRQGLAPGDRVGLFMANAPEYIAALWGAWWAGLVVVPMNARLHGREAAWILSHSGARACLVDAGRIDAELAPFVVDAGIALIDQPARRRCASPVPRRAARTTRPGSSTPAAPPAGPKGVTLTMRNLRWAAMAYVATVQPVNPGDSLPAPGAAVARQRPVPPALRDERRRQRHPDLADARRGRVLRAGRALARGLVLRRADHRAPSGRARPGAPAAARRPGHDRLRRRADVPGRPGGRHRRARAAPGADLRPGREPDDDHRAAARGDRGPRPPALARAHGLGGLCAADGRAVDPRRRRPPPCPPARSARSACAARS